MGEVAERSEDGEGRQRPHPAACKKGCKPLSVTFGDTISNETRFAGLSFEETAARGSALAAAIGVRLARLRADECFFRRACRRKKLF